MLFEERSWQLVWLQEIGICSGSGWEANRRVADIRSKHSCWCAQAESTSWIQLVSDKFEQWSYPTWQACCSFCHEFPTGKISTDSQPGGGITSLRVDWGSNWHFYVLSCCSYCHCCCCCSCSLLFLLINIDFVSCFFFLTWSFLLVTFCCLLALIENFGTCKLVSLQKMHDTAWKLVGDYVAEVVPTWDISPQKSAQGQVFVSLCI